MSMRSTESLRLSREIRTPVLPYPEAAWTVDLCLRVTVSGPVQPATGYVVDAGHLQAWVLSHVDLPEHLQADGFGSAAWLADLWSRLASGPAPGLTMEELELWMSPTWRWTVFREPCGHAVTAVTRSFHFSAAHRIWNPAWLEGENLRVFGKCSNPAGHGHNYVLEVSADMAGGTDMTTVEQTVETAILSKLDHRNLNVDVDELRGVNPTVEALTDLIWDTLESALPVQTLRSIRLYETPKISAERRR